MREGTSLERVVEAASRVELGDPRRKERLLAGVRSLARSPTSTLPSAMGSPARLEGFYRLVNNRAVTFEAIVASQVQVTAERVRPFQDVLAIHDTTTLSPKHGSVESVGYLHTGNAGFLLHCSLAVTLREGQPLGIAHAETLTRATFSKRGNQNKSGGGTTAKWQDRESARWGRGVKEVETALEGCRPVHVMDREADSYALLAQMSVQGSRFVVRCYHDRRARKATAAEVPAWTTLRPLAETMEGVLTREVALSGRVKKSAPRANRFQPPRDARDATLHFAGMRVTIPAPSYLKDVPATLDVNVVRVWESTAPEGEPPVEWLLYTDQPISTVEEVARVVDIYRARWLIEEYFKALKTGCAYETREFESLQALRTMLALTLPIASELLWLRNRSRRAPDAPATDVLTPTQVSVLRAMTKRRLPESLTSAQALAAMAELGGHIKSNGPPGWQILYRAYNALLMYEAGWLHAQRQAEQQPKM